MRRWIVIGTFVAGGLLFALAVGLPTPWPHGDATPALTRSGDSPAPNLTVSVAPGTWTMLAGDAARFDVALAGVPFGCDVRQAIYRWWIPGLDSASGFLNASAGASVRFQSFDSATGSVAIEADASVQLQCGAVPWSGQATGVAMTSIFPGLQARHLVADPNPAWPGASVTLRWQLLGGLGPFQSVVAFGDGASLTMSSDASEAPFVTHRFAAGVYEPTVTVTDAQGNVRSAPARESLVVASTLTVAINVPHDQVDVGASVVANASVVGGVDPYTIVWTDNLGRVATGPTITDTPVGSEDLTLSVRVLDSVGDVGQASRTIVAVPAPSLVAGPLRISGDAGVALPFWANLSGGVPPFTISWRCLPDGALGNQALSSNGRTTLPVVVGLPGPAWVWAGVTDSEGISSTTTFQLGMIFPLPSIAAGVSPWPAEAGYATTLRGLVLGGAPPMNWTVVSTAPLVGTGAPSGSLRVDRGFATNLTFLTPGNVTLLVAIDDAAGVSATANLSLSVVRGLAVAAALGTDTPAVHAPLAISADLSGGVAPYQYRFELSDGETSSGNRSGPGPVTWSATPTSAGFLEIHLVFTDQLGIEVRVDRTVLVAQTAPSGSAAGPAGSAASGVATTPWLAAGAGAAGFVGAILLPRWWPRRRPAGPSPDRRALSVTRELLEEHHGLDRETLLFLAQEEGISEEAARAALDRWSRAGRIERADELEGDEFLTWIDRRAPAGRPESGRVDEPSP